MMQSLIFKAGRNAFDLIRREGGLDPGRIRLMLGASGGPKWLALAQLDRALLRRWLADRSEPLDLLGSSIGTWRFACYARRDPLAAFDRLEETYLGYRYSRGDTPEKVTADSLAILDAVLGPEGAAEILSGPMRLSAVAVRGRLAALNTERRLPLASALALAATSNLVSRRALGRLFERVLFHDPRSDLAYAHWNDFPTRPVPLSPENLKSAIMASCAIPLVLAGIPDIAGAPPGIYRDGGILDYHFDMPVLEGDAGAVALYPHFYPDIVPGWFDKPLRWRRATGERAANLLLIAPAPEFVAQLPYGKIPDRKDFLRLSDSERLAYWRGVLRETERLAEAFESVVEHGRLPDRIEPF